MKKLGLRFFSCCFFSALISLLRVRVSVQIPNRLQSLAVLLRPLCSLSPPPVFTVLLPSNWAQISWLHQPAAAAQLGTAPPNRFFFFLLLGLFFFWPAFQFPPHDFG